MEEEQQSRLERIMGTGFDILADLMRETNNRLERLESRFDNFLSTAGGETRELRHRVNDLGEPVAKLESAD